MTSPWRRWLPLAIPQVVLFGGMLVMLVVHPNAFTSALESPRALVVNALLLAGWLLISLLLVPRLIRNRWWDTAILTAIAVVAIVVLVVPTLRDTKVVEEFPAAVAEPATPTTSPTTAAGAPPTMATTRTTAAPDPVEVSTGELRGIGHDATGTASVYERADGSAVVALEDIDIEPGPDYRVYVVRGTDRESPGDGIELDGLRGNQGTQYYEVPAGTDVGVGWTVLVWCRAFGVPVAGASQIAV